MTASNEYPDHDNTAAGLGLTAAAGTPLREVTGQADDAPAAPEVTLPGHLVHIVLETGLDTTVRVDNRDFLRWDKTAPRQQWDASKQPFLFSSFIAWAAGKRTGVLEGVDFDAFQALALEVRDVKSGPEDEARPTR